MKDEKILNKMNISLPALSVNESVCRSVVGVFCAQLNPTIEELADIKCAVSEAVTNCIVHAYKNNGGVIYISTVLYNDRSVKIEIRDKGCGIADVKQALQPLFTTDPDGERSGMGFSVMETFTDKLSVSSRLGKGTKVTLKKRLS
ncbi:MAG: anti-sigma F factor [Ruminococcaceae bacterium]|nr:anti-sigma F factor [Oscillospiraceae bacterium]